MGTKRAGSLPEARVFLRPTRKGACRAAKTALAAAAICLSALSGCTKPKPQAPALVYPYSAETSRIFYAGASGLSESRPPVGESSAGGSAPAALAPNASTISSDGRTILAAVNGWGLVRIEPKAENRLGGSGERGSAAGSAASGAGSGAAPSYRLAGTPLPSIFAGLTAAGAWPLAGGFLVQLYRDPFVTAAGRTDSSGQGEVLPKARLAFLRADDDSGSACRSFDPFVAEADSGFELFALLPSGGRWFAQLRKEGSERVELKFLALGDPLAGMADLAGAASSAAAGAAAVRPVEIGRAQFEAALEPKALASLGGGEGDRLRTALRALGKGPWLVRLRSSGGADSWYLSAGEAEEASQLYAWAGSYGTLALRSDGWLALAPEGGGTKLESLGEPAPGASYVALTEAGGIVAAAWESGEFPNIASAGLVVAPLPR